MVTTTNDVYNMKGLTDVNPYVGSGRYVGGNGRLDMLGIADVVIVGNLEKVSALVTMSVVVGCMVMLMATMVHRDDQSRRIDEEYRHHK